MGVFGPALAELSKASHPWRDPEVFQDYCRKHGVVGKTAALISVQDFGGLDRELRNANVMVLRMGIDSTQARFALVRAERNVEREFFLSDSLCFESDARPITYQPDKDVLLPFEFLGSLQEGGAVNLAVATGLLGRALNLDEPYSRVAPSQSSSTHTFVVRPHASYPIQWTHESGQVEIDTVFLGRRAGQQKLFVIEAKHGKPGAGLAKHKLAYPAYVMASKPLPKGIEIVPVYLRSWQDGERVLFGVAECTFVGAGTAITTIEPLVRAKVYAIEMSFVR